jgi:hypothetical protein
MSIARLLLCPLERFDDCWMPAFAGDDNAQNRQLASRSFTAPSRSTETSCDTPRSAMVTP